MDILGCIWISKWEYFDIHGNPKPSMDIHGHPWTFMEIHGNP